MFQDSVALYILIWIAIFSCDSATDYIDSHGNQSCIDQTEDCRSPAARVTICSHQKTRIFCMKSCNLCPVTEDGTWNNWSSWSACSATCDVGSMKRSRVCHFPDGKPQGRYCQGKTLETKTCSLKKCPVDGILEDWSDWSSCSVTCGGGQTRRIRICRFPEPHNRGKDCHGTRREMDSCSTQKCPVDGAWKAWSSWSSCSATCGGGQKKRNRICHFQDPANRGRDCQGTNIDTDSCSAQHCPVDGVWMSWSGWSHCPVTCGGGLVTRSRICHFAEPKHRGHDCRGQKFEFRSCDTEACPVDGVWLSWSGWSHCPVTCGGGHVTRSRACHFADTRHRGHNCSGRKTESRSCATQTCPVDGVWLPWSDWSHCPVTCGGGHVTRSRICFFADSKHRGNNCSGQKFESRSCATQKCPVDGRWSTWSSWSSCSASCEGGNKQRHRTCRYPPNSVRGKSCHGEHKEVKRCSLISCPEAECRNRGGHCKGIEQYCHGYHREDICGAGSHCCVHMDDTEFVGCFGHIQIWGFDIGSSFSHNIDTRWYLFPGNMTIQYCIQHCRSFNMNYAALESQSKCECSDTIPHKCQKITNNDCTMRCGGDWGTICGDWGKVSLYRIL